MEMKLLSKWKSFDGEQRVYEHYSSILNCNMKFGVYVPPTVLEDNKKCPTLFYLSGLSCTHENFIHKSGFQQHAAKHGLIVVNADTSPRGVDLPGQDDSFDFGSSAGFYVDATVEPWSSHYKMYSYITKELLNLVVENLPVQENKYGVFGHSMGGHGALLCALKNPVLYQSVSAFAPIANAIACTWGKKALTGYLGKDEESWKNWDATNLATVYNGPPLELLIDQGSEDEFLTKKQLLPENLLEAANKNAHLQTVYKLREGYDHSYYYVATFMSEHIAYHAKLLKC